jgi:hypothetical protein
MWLETDLFQNTFISVQDAENFGLGETLTSAAHVAKQVDDNVIYTMRRP